MSNFFQSGQNFAHYVLQIPFERKVKEEQDKPGKNPDTNKSINVSGNYCSFV